MKPHGCACMQAGSISLIAGTDRQRYGPCAWRSAGEPSVGAFFRRLACVALCDLALLLGHLRAAGACVGSTGSAVGRRNKTTLMIGAGALVCMHVSAVLHTCLLMLSCICACMHRRKYVYACPYIQAHRAQRMRTHMRPRKSPIPPIPQPKLKPHPYTYIH